MRDMYEVLDRWGAWAAADNSGVDWQPIAAGFKGLLPHGKKSRLQCDVQMEQYGKRCKQQWGLLMAACHFSFTTMT